MKISGKIYIGIIFAMLYIPILVIIFFSFNSSNSMAVFSGFSLKWYGELFKNDKAIDALVNSLMLAVSSSLIATVLGTAAAVGIYNIKSKRAKTAVMTVTNIPMMNPDIVTGVSIMLLFAFAATLLKLEIFGFFTMLIAHITFNLPYVILCVMPKLKQMDKNLPEAAMDLGCTPLQAFFKAEFFEILPGIATGMLMAFTLSLDDFVISYFAAGESFQTLPIYIYSMTKRRVLPDMNALFSVIFIVIFALLLIRNLMTKDSSNVKKAVNR
ncbi:MAG: ABC transporter permease [Eubacteriales bacterium]|nr:ABC transporter permease [Eubacteriales bacterium]